MGTIEYTEADFRPGPARRGFDPQALLFERPVAEPPTPKQIANVVARKHGVMPSELLVHGRGKRALVRARQEYWAVLRSQGRSYPEIGRLANRHHTTVLYGIRQYEKVHGRIVPVEPQGPACPPPADRCAVCEEPLPCAPDGQLYEVWWYVRDGQELQETCQSCADLFAGDHGIRTVRQ